MTQGTKCKQTAAQKRAWRLNGLIGNCCNSMSTMLRISRDPHLSGLTKNIAIALSRYKPFRTNHSKGKY